MPGEQYEDWMLMARLVCENKQQKADNNSVDFAADIAKMCSHYSKQEIQNMSFWVNNTKGDSSSDTIQSTTEVDITKLNEKQALVYSIVSTHLSGTVLKPLYMMITEQGGSGKSYIINALKSLLGNNCIVTSFFGIAAFNINGVTLHSLLKLPIRGVRNYDLKGPALSNLQMRLKDVKYIIIDEFSVIGQNMFGWIDKRCCQVTGSLEETFGGISVILVGDIAQLPPVSDKPLYHPVPINSTALMGYYAYQKFTTVVKLQQNQRVTNQTQNHFKNMLIRLRDGESSLEDWRLLLEKNVHKFDVNHLQHTFTKLAFSNESVASYNYEMLQKLKETTYSIKAKHNNSYASKLSSEEFGGLEPLIHLCVGAKVMLTRNLWVEKGLCNGAMGVVKDIIFKHDQQPPTLPIAVIVQFENYSGP